MSDSNNPPSSSSSSIANNSQPVLPTVPQMRSRSQAYLSENERLRLANTRLDIALSDTGLLQRPMPLPLTTAARIALLLPSFVGQIPKLGRCLCLWPPWVDPPPDGFQDLVDLIFDEVARVFAIPVFITILRGESRELEPAEHPWPGLNVSSWALSQVVIRREIITGDPDADRLLDGKIVTGDYRAHQSVLRMLTLLPTNGGFAHMGPAGEPIVAAQFAPHGEGDICTVCGRLQHSTFVG